MKKKIILFLSCALICSVSIVPTSCASNDEQSSIAPMSDVDVLYQNSNFKNYFNQVMNLSEKLKSNTLDDAYLSENEVNTMAQSENYITLYKQIGFGSYNDYEMTVIDMSKSMSKILSEIPQLKNYGKEGLSILFRSAFIKSVQEFGRNNRVANCKSDRDGCLTDAAVDFGVEFGLALVGGAAIPAIAVVGGIYQMYKLGRAVNACEKTFGQCHDQK
jgi:hypothetical protein